jgi:hypothetical protein
MSTDPNIGKSTITSIIVKVLIAVFALLLLLSIVYFVYQFATQKNGDEQEGRLITFRVIGEVSLTALIVLGIVLEKVGKGADRQIKKEENIVADNKVDGIVTKRSVEELPVAEDGLAKLLRESAGNPIKKINMLKSQLKAGSIVVCRHDLVGVMETCVVTTKEIVESTKLSPLECCKDSGVVYMNVWDFGGNPVPVNFPRMADCLNDESEWQCPNNVLEMKSQRIQAFQALKDAELTAECVSGTKESHNFTLAILSSPLYLTCSSDKVEERLAAIYKYLINQRQHANHKLGVLVNLNVPNQYSIVSSTLLNDAGNLLSCAMAMDVYTKIKEGDYVKTLLEYDRDKKQFFHRS